MTRNDATIAVLIDSQKAHDCRIVNAVHNAAPDQLGGRQLCRNPHFEGYIGRAATQAGCMPLPELSAATQPTDPLEGTAPQTCFLASTDEKCSAKPGPKAGF